MKKTMTMRKSLSLTGRCLRDIHRICPGRICSVLLVALLQGLTPYVTIWFSAQLINELAGLRRPELLTRWVLLTLDGAAGSAGRGCLSVGKFHKYSVLSRKRSYLC